MTRFVIGDIHGGSQTLQALLDQLSPKHNDRVYLLGDYIDRGPDSKGVLDIIIGMEESGYEVRPIRGNHEDMLVKTLTGDHDLFSCHWMKGWGEKTLFSFGVKQPEDIPLHYQKFLAGLSYCYEEGEFILVHAGVDLGLDDPVNDTRKEHMAWGSTIIPENDERPLRRVICGHHIRNVGEIIRSRSHQVIYLDNGAFTNQQPANGNLVALNLETMKLTMQPWIDRKAEW